MAITNINNTPGQSTSLKGYTVSTDIFNIVKVWFERRNFTATAAELLAGALISTTIDNGGSKVDVLDLLKTYNGADSAEMQQLTAYLMNIARASSSYVGYESPVVTNQVYSRLVV